MIYQEDLKWAEDQKKINKEFLQKIGKSKPKNLDETFQKLHDETFAEVDCLECANCCKTTSPIFQNGDIERVAKALKMKVADFISEYLHLDDEYDYVLNHAPCPFLGHDNKCIVYHHRPTACREYPHTDRKRMHQIMNLTYQNTMVCPAVSRIVHHMQSMF